jgi:hypothetical protein
MPVASPQELPKAAISLELTSGGRESEAES